MKVTYGTPVPCPNCGSDDIHCPHSFGTHSFGTHSFGTHSFGTQVFCGSCGVSASKVPGNNWQDEEYAAVDIWNKTVAEFHAQPYEIQKEQT